MDVFSAKRSESNAWTLVPDRTAVLVVDMIRDFCDEDGLMPLPGAERLYPVQNAIIDAARVRNAMVGWVVDCHRPGVRQDREFLKRTPHCIEGTQGVEVMPQLERDAGDFLFVKRRYSAFFGTDLDLTLRDNQIDTLIVFGVVTNICVRSTVHDAFFNGYRVVVPHDACAATGPREQDSSLYDIATHFGVVTDSARTIAALKGQGTLENLPEFETAPT